MFQVLQHGRIPAPRTQGRLVVLKQISSLALVGILLLLFLAAHASRPASAREWIMAGAASGDPVCPAQCLVVNDTLKPGSYRGQNVGFTACNIASSAQIWSYDNSSQTISVLEPYSGTMVCLAASNTSQPVSGLILNACVNPTPRSQLWRIDARNASILSISSLPAKFLGSESAFSYVNSLPGFSWRNAVLARDRTFASNGSGQIMMSFVPIVSALNLSSAPSPQIVGNLVKNGGFELCSSDLSDTLPSVTFNRDDIFGPCFWTIDSGHVQVLGPGKQAVEGRLFLGLNGQLLGGTIAQPIPTVPGEWYLLSYLMAADSACGNSVKRMEVTVEPSASTSLIQESFNTTGLNAEKMGWSQRLTSFLATEVVSTVRFRSLESAGCGPYLDDVRVLALPKALEPVPADPNSPPPIPVEPVHTTHEAAASTGAILGAAGAAFLAGGCVLAFAYVAWKSMLRNGKQGVARALSVNFSSRGLRLGAFSSPDSRSFPRTIMQSLSPSKTEASSLHLAEETPGNVHPRQYSYEEIDHATRSFCTVLGRGSGGIVYAAQFDDGTRAAVKKEHNTTRSSYEEFMRDVELLRQTRHPNLVTFLGFCKDQGERILVYEYMTGGSLHEHLHGVDNSPLSWNKRLRIAREVAAGLEYLHHRSPIPILHRNLSSNNVLLTDIPVAKLMDFGLVRNENPGRLPTAHAPKYTPSSAGYMETLRESVYSTKSDVYSFGVLLLELFTGREAFHLVHGARDYLSSKERVNQCLDPRLVGSATKTELEVLTEIVNMCIQHSAEDRPSMQKVTELLQMTTSVSESDNSSEIRPGTSSRQGYHRHCLPSPRSPLHQK